jgi:uncharacterized protein YcbX
MLKSAIGRPVGRVLGIWRYPVKSMAANALTEADVSWHGVAGDRRWAFVRDGVVQSGFPWFTLRERSDLNRYVPSFVDPTQPDKSATRVHTPSGVEYDITDPKLAAELSSNPIRLIKQDRGIFDTFPLSLITAQTIARLSEMTGENLQVERFRPNLLIDACELAPFCEDAWVGHALQIGGVRMRVDKRDGRCAVITIDPLTSKRNPEVLRVVAREREGCIGVYGTTVEPGRIRVNDEVLIEDC